RATRIASLTKADERNVETHYVAENRVLLANIEIRGIGKPAEFLRILLVLRKELHHFMRVGVSRRRKEKSVHHAEHGCVHSNSECEHDHRSKREARRFQQLPKCKFEFLNHVL